VTRRVSRLRRDRQRLIPGDPLERLFRNEVNLMRVKTRMKVDGLAGL
jgi:hypothetical protein